MADLYKLAERIAAGRATLHLHKINRARCNIARLSVSSPNKNYTCEIPLKRLRLNKFS